MDAGTERTQGDNADSERHDDGFRDRGSAVDAYNDAAIELAAQRNALRDALNAVLRYCELNPEGETDFELSVLKARAALLKTEE